MLVPDSGRLTRALRLFSEGALGEKHALSTAFECLGAELSVRRTVLSQVPRPPRDLRSEAQLSRLVASTSMRLTEVFVRLEMIRWMRVELAAKTSEDIMPWFNFGGLAIKDFHLDLGSLMDSIAPVVLHAAGLFDAQGETWFPGFSHIQKKESREAVPESVLATIDSTERWWPDVKRIRDTLVHRENLKLVFGGPELAGC